jgi:GMP synthase-like glutamine amidotransferase
MEHTPTECRILVVQNDVDKGLGRIGDGFYGTGVELDTHMAFNDVPSVEGYDGLIVLPGLGDPVDDDPPIHRARGAILEALELDLPVLGICLGVQLLAQALGGEAYKCDNEVAYHPVRTTPAAQDDPLLAGIPAEYSSFHAHAFAFTAPEGATVLIENDVSLQAMRHGRTWAFQCHPETPVFWAEALARGIRGDFDGTLVPETADFFIRNCVDPDQLIADAHAADHTATSIGHGIGFGFAAVCRGER